MMMMMNNKPSEKAIYRVVGINDLMKHLELNESEAINLLNSGITLDFWWEGTSFEDAKRWTFDGDDIYKDLSLQNFFLANICDWYRGAKILNNPNYKKIESLNGLNKWLHFSSNRITIKNMYFDHWKNAWKF